MSEKTAAISKMPRSRLFVYIACFLFVHLLNVIGILILDMRPLTATEILLLALTGAWCEEEKP